MGYVGTWMPQCTTCVSDGFAARASRPKLLLAVFILETSPIFIRLVDTYVIRIHEKLKCAQLRCWSHIENIRTILYSLVGIYCKDG